MLQRIKRNMKMSVWTTTTGATGLPTQEDLPLRKRSSSVIAKHWTKPENCRAFRALVQRSAADDGLHLSCLSRHSSCTSLQLPGTGAGSPHNSGPSSPHVRSHEGSRSSSFNRGAAGDILEAAAMARRHHHQQSLLQQAQLQQNRLVAHTESISMATSQPVTREQSPGSQVGAHGSSQLLAGKSTAATSKSTGPSLGPSPGQSPDPSQERTPTSPLSPATTSASANISPRLLTSVSAVASPMSSGNETCPSEVRLLFSHYAYTSKAHHLTHLTNANVHVQDTSQESSPTTLFSLKDLHHHAILSTAQLRRWDFPIFELQRQLDTFMLSKVRLASFRTSTYMFCASALRAPTPRGTRAVSRPRTRTRAHRGQARNLIEMRRDSARHCAR